MTLDIGHNRLINTDPAITKYFKPPTVRNKKKPKILPDGVKSLLLDFEDNRSNSFEDSEIEQDDNEGDIEFDLLEYVLNDLDYEL